MASCEDDYKFLRSIVDGLPFALFCKDYQSGKGTFVVWNKLAELLWGISLEKIIGKTDYDIFPSEQADLFRIKDLETLSSKKIVFIPQESADSPALGLRTVRTWKIPLNDEMGVPRYLLGVSQDIADFKKLEEELKVQTQNAIHSARLRHQSEIAKRVAHEMNNPLAIILGRASQLKRALRKWEIPEDTLYLLESILDRTRHTAKKVEAIFTLLNEEEDSGSVKGSPLATRKGEDQNTSDFFHDVANAVAIAKGKSSQALRQISTHSDSTLQHELVEKIQSVLMNLQKIDGLLQSEVGRASSKNKFRSAS